jgi:trehalose/maltose hydrolase-like predicted phosphorylase
MNPWLLTYDGFDPAREGLREALTTLGNGYFATRGAATEASADEVHHPVWQHYQATKDTAFLAGFGGELLLGVARFFASLATCEEGRYTIRAVMGPDEYHDGYPGHAEPGLD